MKVANEYSCIMISAESLSAIHIQNLYEFNVEFEVFICPLAACQSARSPGKLVTHMTQMHPEAWNCATIAVQEAIRYLAREFTDYRISDLPQPGGGHEQIPHLPLVSGYRCLECEHTTTSKLLIKAHARQQHEELGNTSVIDIPFVEAALQRWTQARNASGYFWVTVTHGTGQEHAAMGKVSDGPHLTPFSPRASGKLPNSSNSSKLERDFQECLETLYEQQELVRVLGVDERSPWLTRTKWDYILSQYILTYKDIADLTQTDNYIVVYQPELLADPELAPQKSVSLVPLSTAVKGMVAHLHRNHQRLYWGNSVILHQWHSPTMDTRADYFKPYQNDDTRKSLINLWTRCLCFIVQVENENTLSNTVSGKSPSTDRETPYRAVFTQTIQQQLAVVRQLLTVKQAQLERGLENEPETEDALMDAVFLLSVALVTQEKSHCTTDYVLIHAAAAIAVHRTKHTLASPINDDNYTSTLSKLLFAARLIMLEHVFPGRQWSKGPIPGQHEAHPESTLQVAQRERQQWLVEGCCSVTAEILSQLAYGKSYQEGQTRDTNCHWAPNTPTLYFEAHPVTLSSIQTMCHLAIDMLRVSLHEELLFDIEVPAVSMEDIRDSCSSSNGMGNLGYSFLHGNPQLDGLFYPFLRKASQSKTALAKHTFTTSPEGHITLGRDACKHYIRAERHFLRLLAALVELTAGQPTRSTELAATTIRNKPGVPRSLYILHGLVTIVSQYSKTSYRGRQKYIARYLPASIGQLVILYLIYARPIADAVSKQAPNRLFTDRAHGMPSSTTTTDARWHIDNLNNELKLLTQQHLGQAYTISSWRHIAIAFCKRYLLSASRTWQLSNNLTNEDEENGNPLDPLENADTHDELMAQQAGHSSLTAHTHYAMEAVSFHSLGAALLLGYAHASNDLHVMLNIAEPLSRPNFYSTHPTIKPWTHSSVSHSQHSSGAMDGGIARAASIEQLPRPKQVNYLVRVHRGLNAVLGNGARFLTTWQERAMGITHRIPAQALIVLPTSSGKSMLFLSLAKTAATDKLVVIIVPYIALATQLVERARNNNIRSKRWVKDERIGVEKLLVMVIDDAVSPCGLNDLSALSSNDAIECLFFDECHVLLTETFRECMSQFWKVQRYHIPFVALTATVPLELKARLMSKLLLMPEHCETLIAPSNKPGMALAVLNTGNSALAASLTELQQHINSNLLLPGKRGLIFVRTRAEAAKVAWNIGAPYHISSPESEEQREESARAVANWLSSEAGGWLVATTGLGTGMDFPGLVQVVHLGRPYGITAYVQQAGRAGRNGEPCKSTILCHVTPGTHGYRTSRQLTEGTIEQFEEDTLSAYILDKGCRRAFLARIFDDGSSTSTCVGLAQALCDHCLGTIENTTTLESRAPPLEALEDNLPDPFLTTPQSKRGPATGSPLTPPNTFKRPRLTMSEPESRQIESHPACARQLQREVHKREETKSLELRNWHMQMEVLRTECGRCLFHGKRADDHKVLSCSAWRNAKDEYLDWKRTFVLPNGVHNKCGLPVRSEWCEEREFARPCRYSDIMLPNTCWLLFQYTDFFAQRAELAGYRDSHTRSRLTDWLIGLADGQLNMHRLWNSGLLSAITRSNGEHAPASAVTQHPSPQRLDSTNMEQPSQDEPVWQSSIHKVQLLSPITAKPTALSWERRMRAMTQPQPQCVRCMLYSESDTAHSIMDCAEWPGGRGRYRLWLRTMGLRKGIHQSCGLPFKSQFCGHIGPGDCQWKDTMLPAMFWCFENALVFILPQM